MQQQTRQLEAERAGEPPVQMLETPNPIALGTEAQPTMHAARFHISIGAAEKGPGWGEFVTAIDKLGLSPVYRQARDIVETKLRPLGLPAPPTVFGGGNEIFVSPDSKEAIFVRRANEETRRGSKSGDPGSIYDVLLFSGQNLSEFEMRFGACVSNAFGVSLSAHTLRELRLKDRLSKRLGDLSPNGNLLAEEVVRNACRQLVDDKLRNQVSSVVNAFGDLPAPKSALETLEPFVAKSGELANLVGSPDLASPHYSIACDSCGVSQLLFSDRSLAESALRGAGHRCGTCGAKKLSLQETFAVTGPFVRALRQGLWLESLASDIMCARSGIVWTGQMVESDEIDVVAVFAEQVVLVECKDTSFGQNDLYVTSVKAQNVGADVVIILSTRDIHQNVRSAVPRIGKSSDEREFLGGVQRDFHLVSDSSAQAISGELDRILGDISNDNMTSWIAGNPYSSTIYRHIPRWD